MRQGADWHHKITLPFPGDSILKAEIVYAQQWVPVLTKTVADCTFNGNSVELLMTAEETMRLNHKKSLQIQAQFLVWPNRRVRTDIYVVNVDPAISKVVLA